MEAVNKLEKVHPKHISHYGKGNENRLTGVHETASIDKFSYGFGDRTASLRISPSAKIEDKGFIEDRRPASNMDPYVVSALLMDTIFLDGKLAPDMLEHYDKWSKWESKQNFEFL